MSRFGKYLGYIVVKIEGEEDLEVRPTLRHKQQLLALQQKSSKGLSEADWEKQHNIFKQILKTTYTKEEQQDKEYMLSQDKHIVGFLLAHDMNFMIGLYVGFGWVKEDDLAEKKEEMLEKLVEKN